MNKVNTSTLNMYSTSLSTNGSNGDQISLNTQRVKELFEKAGSQERATLRLTAAQIPDLQVAA